jgi:hypothetical protein
LKPELGYRLATEIAFGLSSFCFADAEAFFVPALALLVIGHCALAALAAQQPVVSLAQHAELSPAYVAIAKAVTTNERISFFICLIYTRNSGVFQLKG